MYANHILISSWSEIGDVLGGDMGRVMYAMGQQQLNPARSRSGFDSLRQQGQRLAACRLLIGYLFVRVWVYVRRAPSPHPFPPPQPPPRQPFAGHRKKSAGGDERFAVASNCTACVRLPTPACILSVILGSYDFDFVLILISAACISSDTFASMLFRCSRSVYVIMLFIVVGVYYVMRCWHVMTVLLVLQTYVHIPACRTDTLMAMVIPAADFMKHLHLTNPYFLTSAGNKCIR